MARFDLSDAEWRIIEPLLPNKPRGVARVDDRRVLNGIFYILRTGSPWRDLPERYGPYTTVYNRFNRWAKAGVWVNIFNALAAKSPESMAFIDSSIIRAHQHAAGVFEKALAGIPPDEIEILRRSLERLIGNLEGC